MKKRELKMRLALPLVSVALAAGLVAGCGSSESTADDGYEVVVGGTNAADERFVEHMVPHHQDAVDMSEELLENGQNPTLQKLAEEIIEAQRREIDLMNEVMSGEGGAGGGAAGGSGADVGAHDDH